MCFTSVKGAEDPSRHLLKDDRLLKGAQLAPSVSGKCTPTHNEMPLPLPASSAEDTKHWRRYGTAGGSEKWCELGDS